MRLVGLTAAAEQLLVELEVFLAGRVLHAHGHRDAGGLDRAFAEHRKFLEDEFEIGVGLEQLDHVGQRALAVAAIVVEELDHGDLALRVAEHDLVGRGKQRRFVVAHRGAMLLGLGVLLALLQLRHDVLDHLGVRHQVVLDDALDLLVLVGGERLGLRALGSHRCHEHRGGRNCHA